MSVINQTLLLAGDDAYNLTKSLRFRKSASAYLNRTPASAGNRKTWTFSGWVKRSNIGSTGALFGGGTSGSNYGEIYFSNDAFSFYNEATATEVKTSAVYRDPSAWYHLIVATDTTQATSSNRVKLYVNGVQQTSLAGTTNYPSQNADLYINSASIHSIGSLYYTASNTDYLDGYLTEVNFIDGQQLTASSFGQTDVLTGVWKPKKYAGTYGTNGFYLPFTDVATTSGSNAGLGKDFSGNGNYWNTNNISVTAGSTYDSMNDVPTLTSATTANYAVLNPLEMLTGMNLSQGNLYTVATSGYDTAVKATMPVPLTGKYYWEILDVSQGNRGWMGLYHTNRQLTSSLIATTPYDISYGPWDGKIYVQSGTASGTYSTSTTNDIVMFAVDADNGKLYVGKNGTWFNSGVPASGTGFVASLTSGQQYSPWFGETGGTVTTVAFNFGQRPFNYTPPTGFVALNTYNLPTSTIVKGNTVMDALLYTGNGSASQRTDISWANMQPDMVWVKSRSGAYNNDINDDVRGVTQALCTNSTAAEDGPVAFGADGFGYNGVSNQLRVYTADQRWNANTATYVAWGWKASGASAISNTSGSITSTVSANPTAGFSVVTYTGNGSGGATVGHGLGVAPKMIIVKRRDSGVGSTNWYVYNANLNNGTNPAQYYLQLQSTSGQGGASSIWNDTAPTSSVFSVGTSSETNGSGGTFVAYCWSEIAGFSKFGSYTGNGSADGTFVHLGFRPKLIMIKSTANNDWWFEDTSRSTYNVMQNLLYPNSSNAELVSSSNNIDALSNGFKLRTTDGAVNTSSQTYIYMAFAEVPTKFALAR